MTSLSPRSKQVLGWIQGFCRDNHFFPTFREIQNAFGFKSVSSAQYHVRQLKTAGLVISDSNKARTLRLVENEFDEFSMGGLAWNDKIGFESSNLTNDSPKGIPVLGEIAAGGFVEVFPSSNRTDYILEDEYPEGMGDSGRFALRVRGDSMVGANILNKDIVVLDKPANPREVRNKSIVAARLKDEEVTTLKRWSCKGKDVSLTPENPDYPTLYRKLHEVTIEGVFTGLIFRENP